jgi:ubiquinone/menaquinone biosynthesis C-methylase UbiE
MSLLDKLRRAAADRSSGEAASPREYGAVWTPEDETEAMSLILNETDSETFESTGRRDAEEIMGSFIRPSDAVLDFGCGIGRVTKYVAPLCREVWGVDVSPSMLEFARKRLADLPNVRFALCNGISLDEPPSGSIDFLYSLLTLQHVEREDAFALLREFHRVLKSGGLAHLTFPNLLSDDYLNAFVHYVDSGEVRNPARARMYTPEEVRRILPAAGFEILELDDGVEIRVTSRAAGGLL